MYDTVVTEVDDTQYRFELTCAACPEQYDVFVGAEQVGYVRLRHGTLRADYPTHRTDGGKTVFVVYPQDTDGCFNDHDQRMDYLHHIAKILHRCRTIGDVDEEDYPYCETCLRPLTY